MIKKEIKIMAKLLSETKVRTNNIRASYEHLLKPSAFPGAAEKYSLCAIVDKNDKETLAVLNQAIKNAEKRGVEKYGTKFASAKKHNPLHDGDTEKAGQAGYANGIYFNCSNTMKPKVLDASTGMDADETAIYSGMYGKLIVSFYPYFASAASCGVSCTLLGFQKTRDGEVLGGMHVSESDFDDDEDSFLN